MKFTEEMLKKAKGVKSAEELLTLAKENNVEMTAEEAAGFFAKLNPTMGELSDDELDAVAGGGCAEPAPEYKEGDIVALVSKRCPDCNGSVFKITYVVKESTRMSDYWLECSHCGLTATTAWKSDIAGRIQ